MSAEEPSDRAPEKRKWRKRKTFLVNARKYAKKGRYGRGSELDADTYQYFVRILEAYREGFDSDEDKLNFVNNVFEQTENNEVDYSCNQVGCRVIEMLLPFANDTVLERYMAAFGANLRPLCSDPFASHVIEALVKQSCIKSFSTSETECSDHTVKCKDFTIKVSMFLLNNLEDYAWDTYGNHVIRSALSSLAQLLKCDVMPETDFVDIPEKYSEIVREYAQRFMAWPQFDDLVYTEITSGLLQVILRALAKLDLKLLRQYVKKLIKESFHVDDNGETRVFTSKAAIMLLEVALQTATPKLFTKLNSACFSGKLASLTKSKNTGFAVQKLLTHCTDKAEFESMFDELSSSFEEIIQAGNTSIILSLAQTCKRLATKQGMFLQCLMKTLHCFEPEDRQRSFILCMCKFVTFENVPEAINLETEKLNLHGTLIMQMLLEFNKPIKIVMGILNMETDDVANLFSNSMGSHIVDSYVKSQYVGEKSREKLIRKLQGTYQKLASSKYGSRSFEALWNAASLKFKLNIMQELEHKDGMWSNSPFGRIIAVKVNMSIYKQNREEWKNSLNKSAKVKELSNLLKT